MPTKKKAAEAVVVEPKPVTVLSFKGFNAEFKCRGFQYEVGATYEHKGNVEACASGYHACENPFDVLQYYPLLNDDGKPNRFALVEQGGKLARHNEDTKIASASITIKAELSIPEFVKRSVSWLIDSIKASGAKDERVQAASGDSSQLAASGNYSQLAASGDSSKLAASGNYSQLAASGNYSQLAASGDSSQLAASGNYSQLAASGDSSQLAASGNYSKLAASGNYSQLAASGDSSQLAASGDSSKLAASGNYSKLAASGDSSKLAASGKDSVIASSAIRATAQGAEGTWISLAEFDANDKCIGFAVGKIGTDGLLADTWYRASGGKLVKA